MNWKKFFRELAITAAYTLVLVIMGYFYSLPRNPITLLFQAIAVAIMAVSATTSDEKSWVHEWFIPSLIFIALYPIGKGVFNLDWEPKAIISLAILVATAGRSTGQYDIVTNNRFPILLAVFLASTFF